MAQIIRGPFTLKFGPNATLADIETLKFDYTVDNTDVATVQGKKRRLFGSHLVSVTATFLESDVTSLAQVLPQYFVANGGVLSTGETVTSTAGAIDIVPGGTASTQADLIITNTGSSQVLRVIGCITEIAGVSVDDKVETIDVEFTGQSDLATMQLFAGGAISVIS